MAMHTQEEITSQYRLKRERERGSIDTTWWLEPALLLERTHVWFPAHKWGYKQQPVTPAPDDPVPLASSGPCTHTLILRQKQTPHTHISK